MPHPYCGNCDNCLHPPDTWDATDAARKLLSTVYRVQQAGSISFGAGHIMDIVRGKASDKVAQYGHEQLSTWGIGSAYSEAQLRGVLRQLIAIGALHVDAQAFNTLQLLDAARPILKGEQSVRLREMRAAPKRERVRQGRGGRASPSPAAADLDSAGQARFAALKAWRAEVAREHNLPAYVIFHDATLAAIAASAPTSVDALEGISGIGATKRDKYGPEVIRALAAGGER